MARYYVTTYDPETETFTPQRGVRTGPYKLFGLRKALRALRGMAYEATRLPRSRVHGQLCGSGDPSVYVERCDDRVECPCERCIKRLA